MTAHALEAPPAEPRQHGRVGARIRALGLPAALAASLVVVAFAARTIGADLFITPDEDNWMRRAGNFSRALATGRLHQTYQTGHPGVTTMWVASLGMGPQAARLGGVTLPDDVTTIVTRHPDWPWLFERARRAMMAANALLLTVAALLAWRLLGAGPAILGGLLMALDPFMVAHGQVVHVDALATGFMTLALLAGAVHWLGGGGWGYLALCGVACGLGVLTKAPSFFLGLVLPVLAVVGWALDRERWPLPRLVLSLAACGLVALVTVFAAFPALWVAPVETIGRIVEYQRLQSATPHGPGNFFLGRAVADPGAWYYPIAISFRLTPVVVAGLALLAIVLPPAGLRRQTYALLLFAVGFGVFLTLASKKLDRYALPLFPALALLAAVGFWSAWLAVRPRLDGLAPRAARGAAAGLVGAVALVQAGMLLSVAPYPLAYYNPLVGGGPAAERVILVGWGEGLDQVAAYLNAQPDAARARIAVYYPLALNFQGMVAGTVHRFADPVPTDYVVDYVNASQRGQIPPEIVGRAPDFVARINGIAYAEVYRLSPPRLLSTRAGRDPSE